MYHEANTSAEVDTLYLAIAQRPDEAVRTMPSNVWRDKASKIKFALFSRRP